MDQQQLPDAVTQQAKLELITALAFDWSEDSRKIALISRRRPQESTPVNI